MSLDTYAIRLLVQPLQRRTKTLTRMQSWTRLPAVSSGVVRVPPAGSMVMTNAVVGVSCELRSCSVLECSRPKLYLPRCRTCPVLSEGEPHGRPYLRRRNQARVATVLGQPSAWLG